MEWKFVGSKDLDWIMETAREMHAESNWSKKVKFREDKVKRYFHMVLTNPEMFGIIAHEDDRNIGFMTGTIMEYSFGTEKFAREMDLYVKKEHRGKMAAIVMMKMFKAWAKTKGAKEIIFEPGGVDNTDRFNAMAKRLNMKEVGKIYRGDL